MWTGGTRCGLPAWGLGAMLVASVAFGLGGFACQGAVSPTSDGGAADGQADADDRPGDSEPLVRACGHTVVGSLNSCRVDWSTPVCSGQFCNPDGLCWLSPRPQGHALRQAFPVCETGVWVVGDFGTILLWDGVDFLRLGSGTQANLYSVWAADMQHAWAVGEGGTVLRWDGIGWSPEVAPTTADLWAVRGLSATDVFAVGTGGTVIHRDSSGWSGVASATTDNLNVVEPCLNGDLLVGGHSWAIWLLRAGVWTSQSLGGVFAESLWSSTRLADDDVWVVGNEHVVGRWDGSTWTKGPEPPDFGGSDLLSIWGSSPGDLWLVSRFMSEVGLYHGDGSQWQEVSPAPGAAAVTQAGGGRAWVFGGQGLLARAAQDGTYQELSRRPALYDLRGVYALSASDVWVAGQWKAVGHWDGASWTVVRPHAGSSSDRFESVWATAPDDVWFAGGLSRSAEPAEVAHWDGSSLTTSLLIDTSTTPIVFRDIWASGPASAWVLAHGLSGSGTTIHRWEGGSWSTPYTLPATLNGIWGTADDDVWVVGSTTYHWNGQSWTQVAFNGPSVLDDVWGSGPTEIFAAGRGSGCDAEANDGYLLRSDGAGWSVMRSGMACSWRMSVTGTGGSDLTIAAGSGLEHWDGSQWTHLDGLGPLILGLGAAPTGEVFAVGPGAMVVRWGR